MTLACVPERARRSGFAAACRVASEENYYLYFIMELACQFCAHFTAKLF